MTMPAAAAVRRSMHRHRGQLLVALTLVCIVPNVSLGYGVLTHEAIIDSMWIHDITPVLLRKFPAATTDELRQAHGYAYGGAIIQDMGYYPFGSKFYSDLTHYVRSGAFVEALLHDAQDLDEYAFAIGALSHYWADNGGHPIATNVSVAILYPKLRRKFGDAVTYEKSPSAHLQTEFGFDVLQIAQGHYASESYHEMIGFKVAKPLLQRAFKETYGVELASQFLNLDFALNTYRHSVAALIPMLTRVAWQSTKRDMARQGIAQKPTVTKDSAAVESPSATPRRTREQFLYNLSRAEYTKEWGDQFQKPTFFAKVLAFLFRLVPKIGPFKGYAIQPSTPATELLFMRGFDATTVSLRKSLATVGTAGFTLANTDLDTGKPTSEGEYELADQVYGHILHSLANDKFRNVTPALSANITAFYRDTTMHRGTKGDSAARRTTLSELQGLRESAAVVGQAGKQAP